MDVICFSHLRWDFVYQRPQHLMTRFAKVGKVYFIEEPVFTQGPHDEWHSRKIPTINVQILVPALSKAGSRFSLDQRMKALLDVFIAERSPSSYVTWYYSPLALAFSDHLRPDAVIYDCMDELSAFKGASPELVRYETQIFNLADVVFTGGHKLFEAKKSRHSNIYPFPSSIDREVFMAARLAQPDPADQSRIGHPRMGFVGVLDERLDTLLLREIAEMRPHLHLILIGPTVKIDPADLPRLTNIHYLGMKDYARLPEYISGWDLCMMPFAINPSTEFISPTKTPEFLAAGKKVISTPIHDVVHPYGDRGLVGIADGAEGFVELADKYLLESDGSGWLDVVDDFLSHMSWDHTFQSMYTQISKVMFKKSILHRQNGIQHV